MLRAIVFLVALLLTPSATSAQMSCAPVTDLLANITGLKFGETLQETAAGQFLGKPVVVLTYANPLTKTWSVIAVQPSGLGCMVWSGTDWKRAPVGEPA